MVQEGLKLGMSHADVTKVYTQTGGVIWKDYDEKLAKARVGPEMTALEAERETQKAAFRAASSSSRTRPPATTRPASRASTRYKNL